MKEEGKRAAREVLSELGRELVRVFVAWVKSRPLKRARARRKGQS
jgi:hypothetical protein